MKELYKMTKEELIARCRRLQSENERLKDELNDLSDYYVEMENELADRINSLDEMNSIVNVNYFIWRLQIDGVMTSQLESFIENYLKFYNEIER